MKRLVSVGLLLVCLLVYGCSSDSITDEERELAESAIVAAESYISGSLSYHDALDTVFSASNLLNDLIIAHTGMAQAELEAMSNDEAAEIIGRKRLKLSSASTMVAYRLSLIDDNGATSYNSIPELQAAIDALRAAAK